MTQQIVIEDEWSDLAARVAGRVVLPGAADWDEARRAWNLAVDQRPEAVVQVDGPADIEAVVRFARDHRLQVVAQSTGHLAGAVGDLSGTILVRTDRLQELTVDPVSGTVRAGAGVVMARVALVLEPHGLAALAGSTGDVGVVGYTLGGGVGWLGRRHGLAASRVSAVELVTGDGVFRRVDARNDPELFWAVRGGVGNIGVVCALEFGAVPVAEVYAGAMLFPIARAPEVFDAYARLTEAVDDSATTCVRLLRVPPLPDLPEFLRGKEFAGVDGAFETSEEQASRWLSPLRGLRPVVDSFAPMPTSELRQIHMDPPEPVPALGDGMLLEDFPAEAMAALLASVGPEVQSPLLAVDVRHVGGALGTPDPAGGVVDHLPGRYLMFAVGVTPGPEQTAQVRSAITRLQLALQPWAGSREYTNFRESATPLERFFDAGALHRLRQVQEKYDPDKIVRGAHALS